jgi:hypothetical protein
MPIGGFAFSGGQGQDCEFLRLAHVQKFHLTDVSMTHVAQGPDSLGAIVFEGACNNSEIDRVRYVGHNDGTAESAQTDVFAYESVDTTNGPGEFVFGPGCRFRKGYGRALHVDSDVVDSVPGTYWYCHSERWEQDYAINNEMGSLHLCNTALFGHPDEGNEGGGMVNVEGVDGDGDTRVVTVSNQVTLGRPKPPGYALRLNGLVQFRVEPFTTYGTDDQTIVSVPTAPRRHSLLPNEAVLRGGIDATETEAGTAYDVVRGVKEP